MSIGTITRNTPPKEHICKVKFWFLNIAYGIDLEVV